jgi:hypothetical protein
MDGVQHRLTTNAHNPIPIHPNHPPPQCAVPLPSIIRSPQLEGYRNKAEFTIGLDAAGRPAVGFLLGSFKASLAGEFDRRLSCFFFFLLTASFNRSTGPILARPVSPTQHACGEFTRLVY